MKLNFTTIRSTLMLIGLGLTLSIQAQAVFPIKNQSHVEELNLKGKVEKVTDYTFMNEEEETDPNTFSIPQANFQVIKELVFNEDGNLISNKLRDSNSYGIEVAYFYNADNQLTVEKGKFFRGDSLIMEHKYDKEGNRAQSLWFRSLGELYKRYTAEFDKEGNRLSTQEWNLENKKESLEKYEYKGGQLSAKRMYNTKGENYYTESYTYNSHGDLSMVSGFDSKGKRVKNQMFDYEYLNDGNWIRQTTRENGEFKQIIRRKIEYFGQPKRETLRGLKKLR